MTIVTPVYQEDPVIFRHAIESWLANEGVDEIICVIDVTDRRPSRSPPSTPCG